MKPTKKESAAFAALMADLKRQGALKLQHDETMRQARDAIRRTQNGAK